MNSYQTQPPARRSRTKACVKVHCFLDARGYGVFVSTDEDDEAASILICSYTKRSDADDYADSIRDAFDQDTADEG